MNILFYTLSLKGFIKGNKHGGGGRSNKKTDLRPMNLLMEVYLTRSPG